MLLRMAQYIIRDPDADVPVTVGVKWGSHVKVGNVPGEIAGMAAVEVGKLGKVHLFVASAAGDKLFRPKGEDFEDATAAWVSTPSRAASPGSTLTATGWRTWSPGMAKHSPSAGRQGRQVQGGRRLFAAT